MGLVDEACPKCGAEQTEILAAINVTTDDESYNLYRCLECKFQHQAIRTDEQQQKTIEFIKTDEEIKADSA